MAEVVEINIISRVVLDNDILFSFIHEQVEIQGNRTIEAMNNWAYEGLHRLGSKEDIQNLLDTKIVCITQKAVDGYVGLNIEKVDKRFYYTIWFNNNKYENINVYMTRNTGRCCSALKLGDCLVARNCVCNWEGGYF